MGEQREEVFKSMTMGSLGELGDENQSMALRSGCGSVKRRYTRVWSLHWELKEAWGKEGAFIMRRSARLWPLGAEGAR